MTLSWPRRLMNSSNIMNRVVIITGSTRGIGLATAKEFIKNDDYVVIFCRHQHHVESATKELKTHGSPDHILSLVGDVKNSNDIKQVIKATLRSFGRIDILINNAGIGLFKTIDDTTEQEWDEVLNINLKGQYICAKEVLPVMRKQKIGTIINISSGLGESASAKYGAYASSKFGILGFTEVLTDEVKDDNIKVYAVMPGGVNTKLHLDMHPWEDGSKMMQPEYIGKKIFDLAEGKKDSGFKLKIYR